MSSSLGGHRYIACWITALGLPTMYEKTYKQDSGRASEQKWYLWPTPRSVGHIELITNVRTFALPARPSSKVGSLALVLSTIGMRHLFHGYPADIFEATPSSRR